MSATPPAFPDGLAEFCRMRQGARFAPVIDLHGFALDLAKASACFGYGAMVHLRAMGVPVEFANRLLMQFDLARAKVSVAASGLFEWDGAEAHLLIGVREFGELVDVVAVRSAAPDEWSMLRGDGWVLGHDALFEAKEGLSDLLRVFGTPFDWLRSSGEGICVLDWTAHALAELRGLGPSVTLQCDDHRAAQRLGAVLAWQGLPRVEAVSRRKAA